MNPAGRRILETDDAEMRAKPYWPGLWEGEAREAAEKACRSALMGKGSHFTGFRTTPRGTPKWWDVVVRPIAGADGRVEKLLAVLRDITDAYVIGLLKLRLATYGKPEFTSDAAHYTPVAH